MNKADLSPKRKFSQIHDINELELYIFESSTIDKDTMCWNWNLGKDKEGYGVIWYNGNNRRAHRISYMVYKDRNFTVVNGKDFICHSCDNKSCVNPEHLFIGNNQTNQEDYILKKLGKLRPIETRLKERVAHKKVRERKRFAKTIDYSNINIKFEF